MPTYFQILALWSFTNISLEATNSKLIYVADDGDSKHLRNVGKILPDYRMQQSGRELPLLRSLQ
jgi:hypothetical protein